MGYRDKKLCLSASQLFGASADSTYYIDTELTNPHWDVGYTLGVVLTVETAPGGTTAVTFEICHYATEPTHDTTQIADFEIPTAQLTKGREFVLPLPIGLTILRNIRVYVTIGDGTTGVYSMYVTPIQVAGHL